MKRPCYTVTQFEITLYHPVITYTRYLISISKLLSLRNWYELKYNSTLRFQSKSYTTWNMCFTLTYIKSPYHRALNYDVASTKRATSFHSFVSQVVSRFVI